MSSASLISAAYLKLTRDQQEEHVKLFAKLCQDETPMVRRVAAKYLGKMVENVAAALGRTSLDTTSVIPSLLLPLYEELASNEQPVRSLFLLTQVMLNSQSLTLFRPIHCRTLFDCKLPRIVFHLAV
jgi:serine/threonine-protein phosphatase 2A regulatory subunit A